jgi:UDP-2,4-diacetamido-2,4,6-trideoxy-beta-L-altropyranose hydrolase
VILFRCDASSAIGLGHLARCLVLAQEWVAARRGRAAFVMGAEAALGRDRVEGGGFEMITLPPGLHAAGELGVVASAAQARGARLVVVDHYQRDETYLQALASRGLRLLAVDDIAEHPFPVDILLNQNPGADRLPYRTRPDTLRLLGARYTLVGAAYRRARPARPRAVDRVGRLLISLGGSDPDDVTSRVLASLETLAQALTVDVVVGRGYRKVMQLQERARASRHRVNVHLDLPHLAGPMSAADLLVGAGGGTTWEACCLGLPMVLVPLAANQRPGAAQMVSLGAALVPPGKTVAAPEDVAAVVEMTAADGARLGRAAAAAFALVDGQGARRVVDALG